jgi:hypothetical protein
MRAVLLGRTNWQQARARSGATQIRNLLPRECFPANGGGVCRWCIFQNRPVDDSGRKLNPRAGWPLKIKAADNRSNVKICICVSHFKTPTGKLDQAERMPRNQRSSWPTSARRVQPINSLVCNPAIAKKTAWNFRCCLESGFAIHSGEEVLLRFSQLAKKNSSATTGSQRREHYLVPAIFF